MIKERIRNNAVESVDKKFIGFDLMFIKTCQHSCIHFISFLFKYLGLFLTTVKYICLHCRHRFFDGLHGWFFFWKPLNSFQYFLLAFLSVSFTRTLLRICNSRPSKNIRKISNFYSRFYQQCFAVLRHFNETYRQSFPQCHGSIFRRSDLPVQPAVRSPNHP